VNGEIEGRVTDKQDKFIPTRISPCLRSHHAVISSYQEQSDARPVRVSVGALATIATLCKIKEKSRIPGRFLIPTRNAVRNLIDKTDRVGLELASPLSVSPYSHTI